MSQFGRTLFLFRRDLRIHDNTGLIEALSRSREVIPCFIFDPKQLIDNPYRGDSSVQFMLDSIKELQISVEKLGGNLYLAEGVPSEVIEKIILDHKIEAVFANQDYTPYSKHRDQLIGASCSKLGIQYLLSSDYLLQSPDRTRKADDTPYTVFTPFFNNSKRLEVKLPTKNKFKNYSTIKSQRDRNFFASRYMGKLLSDCPVKGGRESALRILDSLERFSNYTLERDFPAENKTTLLSPHNKFGTVSIREVYHQIAKVLGKDHTLIRELYWRDFFTTIAYFFPHIFKGPFHRKYENLEFDDDKERFDAWCRGATGFPIVDAGMRQLNTTGLMHNRVRMIVASFLTKDLHISWRWGERFFSQKLVDYDPSVNNGNWQWAASTGCDAQPYFRIFNPWLQQAKFDKECKYIKHWVPELDGIDPKVIHSLHETSDRKVDDYVAPIVDHAEEKEIAEERYGECNKRD